MPLDSSGEAGKERTAFRQPWRFPGIWWHGGGAGKFQRGSGGQDPCWRPAAMTLLSPAGPGTRLGKFQRRCCRAQGSLSGKIQERVSICPRSKVMATHPLLFIPGEHLNLQPEDGSASASLHSNPAPVPEMPASNSAADGNKENKRLLY